MNGDIRDQLAKGYEAIENAKACFDKAKEMLEAKESAPPRNWPKRIEAGMVFQSPGTTATWMATDVDGLFVCLKGETDSFKAAGRTMRLERDNVPHAGHARDILAIRTDAHEPVEGIDEQRQKYANASEYYAAARAPKAHEPTGAELVECLKSIRDVSTNPGRTLTFLGLTECLESCHRFAVDALRKLAK